MILSLIALLIAADSIIVWATAIGPIIVGAMIAFGAYVVKTASANAIANATSNSALAAVAESLKDIKSDVRDLNSKHDALERIVYQWPNRDYGNHPST